MQVPSTPATVHVGGGAPLDELLLDDELLLLDVDEDEDELVLEVDEELLELELDPVGVQHSMLDAPGQ